MRSSRSLTPVPWYAEMANNNKKLGGARGALAGGPSQGGLPCGKIIFSFRMEGGGGVFAGVRNGVWVGVSEGVLGVELVGDQLQQNQS